MSTEKKKNLHDLDLHEVMMIKTEKFSLRIVRVPGGWIYYRLNDNDNPGVFVPKNAEFKGKDDFFVV